VVDGTVIRSNAERHWLYAAVDPQTDELLHTGPFQTRATQLTVLSLTELREDQRIEEATVLIDGALHLEAVLRRLGLRSQPTLHGNSKSSNIFLREKISNIFVSIDVQKRGAGGGWILAFAVRWSRCDT
jgi:putative transposase